MSFFTGLGTLEDENDSFLRNTENPLTLRCGVPSPEERIPITEYTLNDEHNYVLVSIN